MKILFAIQNLFVLSLALTLTGAFAEDSFRNEDVDGIDVPGHHDGLSSSSGLLMETKKPRLTKKPKRVKCTTNSDCNATSPAYCAAGRCLPMQSCRSNKDCNNPANQYPTVKCIGPLVCSEYKKCFRKCGPECKKNRIDFRAEKKCGVVPPCDIAKDICISTSVIAGCKNDYCDGCNALVFDEAGKHELCIGPIKGEVICESTQDCATDGSEYCSPGICTPSGQCKSTLDCYNPENIFATIACVGPLSCDTNGFCGRTCADSACTADTTTELSNQCSHVSCEDVTGGCRDEYTNCVDYPCDDDSGWCRSLVFNPSGEAICQEWVDVVCETTQDCAPDGSEYCSQGKCIPSGQCQSTVDCYNPENNFATIACVGPLSCDANGFCGRTCADSACPADGPDLSDQCSPVSCDAIKTACNDEVTNCVNYSCGDDGECQSLVFSPSGQAVCQTVEGGDNIIISESTCESSEDCSDSQYCQRGLCVDMGSCLSDVDCFNPENTFPVILCIGPIFCNTDTNRCGKTCGATDCPPNRPPVQCKGGAPCKTLQRSCPEKVSSCVNQNCGGCNALAFDRAGNQVCQVKL